MDTAAILDAIRALPLAERLKIVEIVWDEIGPDVPLTDAQAEELDRRLADHLAHPEDVIPWEVVKASALARVRQP